MSYDAHVSAYAALIIDIVLDATNDIDGAPDACEAGPVGLHRAADWPARWNTRRTICTGGVIPKARLLLLLPDTSPT